LRILILASEWPPSPGGVSALSLEQARGLAELGCDVRVVSLEGTSGPITQPAGPQTLTVEGVVVKAKAIWRLPALIRLAIARARHWQPDVIYCPAYRGFGVPGLVASRIVGAPLVLYFHGTELRTDGTGGPRRWLLRRCLRHAAVVLANTNNTVGLIRGVDPNLSKPVLAVHPGAAIAPFAQPANLAAAPALRESLLSAAGIPREAHDQATLFVAVCRMHRGKGIGTAIRALARLRAEQPDKRLVYALVGEGPHLGEFRELAEELGVSDRVIFCGPAPYGNTAQYYLAADAYLQPSQPEGPFLESYGIAFVEAQAAGLPCIGTNWGGVPEATRPGETAWLVEPGSVEQVAGAMERVPRLSLDERAMIGFRGRAFAKTRTWEAHCAQLLDLIRQYCPAKPAPRA
jgi:phosphatidylinositol alpha-1,6-mannosyltransferase